jgi:hypothetical protein
VLGARRDAFVPHDGNWWRPSGRPRSMRLTLALMLIVVGAAGACGERSTAGRDGQWETYTSDIDGVVVSYPPTWRRPEVPLAGALTGDQFEVLGLATGELPEGERGCFPYPWAAMRALGAGDLVLTLRISAFEGPFDEWAETGIREPLASKPDDLLDQEPMPPGELPGGCAVEGVEQRQVDFVAHGRLYTAFLAHGGNLSEQRREELRAVWSSLTLNPIPTGDESATIGERYWHVLYAHCGIHGTQFAGRDWVAEPVLDDGNGNPPAGWGNPAQPGVISLTGPNHAELESRDGALKATFRPRTPADPPGQACA